MTDETSCGIFSGVFLNEDAVRSSLQEQHAIVGVILLDGRVATYLDSQSDHGGCVRNRLNNRMSIVRTICDCKRISHAGIKIISTNDDLAAK
ncbi:MAG: hypothetical protein BWY51_00044 [Parcubacteria group bacterium ADurb.Bin316]|nr:MAG: hypothetical protein BWY51_00044 [Parcubacteria group bacterium ADurb.Bin316]HOZ56008.1 hypothetical protein [bacterium]